MIKRMHHVGIAVNDIEVAKRFVTGVLGLKLDRELEVPARRRRTAWFHVGEVDIELVADLDGGDLARTPGEGQLRLDHVAFEVPDVAAAVAELAAKGVRVDAGGVVRVGSRENAWTDPGTSGGVVFQLTAEVTGK